MKFFYNLFIYYFVKIKLENNENKLILYEIKKKLINHTSKIPDYFSFLIILISSIYMILILFIFIIFFAKIKIKEIFNFLYNKNVLFFYELIKYHNNVYQLIISNKETKKVNFNNIQNLNKKFDESKILDFIIIGSGPGGSVIAEELQKNNCFFQILESGFKNEFDDYSYEEILYKYKNAGVNLTFGNSQISYVEAMCVGGGSEINSGLYHELPIDILKVWEDKYQLNIKKMKNFENIYSHIKSKLSIQKYSIQNHISEAGKIFHKGALSLNLSSFEVPRWIKYDQKTKNYVKQTMTKTYLNEKIIKENLIQNTKVSKIAYKKTHWEIYVKQINKSKIYKSKSIVLSAGAINTPFILINSGIKKNVGRQLQMHPTLKVVALFDKTVNYKNMGVATFQARSNNNKNVFYGSSISSVPFLKIALDHISYSEKLVDENWKKMAIYYVSIKPEGVGSISKLPYFKDPVIKYNLTIKDQNDLAKGLKTLCKILINAGSIKIFPSMKKSNQITNYEDIHDLPDQINPKNSNLFSVHLFSSCPMGENKDICVTDSFGKVNNHNNLYICDSSILPTATRVNPQGTLMLFAHQIANKIRQSL